MKRAHRVSTRVARRSCRSVLGDGRPNFFAAHKIALDPTAAQQSYFVQAAGTARFAWNWALEEWQRQYRLGDRPSEATLRCQLNAVKRTQFPWMLEVTKVAPQQAIKDLGTAFRGFFDRRTHYPRFKRKGRHDSFRADNGPGTFTCSGRRIRVPKVGWVQMREALRFTGTPTSVVISRTADRWFASVVVRIADPSPVSRRDSQAAVVGVDLGVSHLATLSDGTRVDGPHALGRHLAALQRLSRALSRKARGSSNRRKARGKVARLHARIVNVRQDALHQLTTMLVRRWSVIVIEDLNVRGMMANGRMGRAVADVGMYEFRRQLEYKCAWYGATLVIADRWYPSSKRCSVCGHVLETLPLSSREWTCPSCGAGHDRDRNAALNLASYVETQAASSAVSACGAEGSDRRLWVMAKPAVMKQEPMLVTVDHA